MNFIEAAIVILLLATLSVPLAQRFRLPLEIFLFIGSCIISLIPGFSSVQINPLIVFNLFLPPILFYAAYFTSWRDFKFNLRPISLLAFGLVIFTTVAVAIGARFIMPMLSWGECFLLGAIVSPTDATAATAIIKKLGAPRRLITVLEGESLVNDATALLLFRFILAAILSGTFSIPQAVGQFFVITTGGAILGLVIGYVAIFFLRRLHNTQAETTLTFITAFTCYLVGEHLGVSGVITTVVCGIYLGIRFPEFSSTQTRINAKMSWNTLLFIVNGFVFALIGLSLSWIAKNLAAYSAVSLIVYGLSVSLIVIIVRILWVFITAHLSRILVPSIARKDPMPPWQALFILSWSGMRGIVSLAAALSLPYQIEPGTAFSNRDLIIMITYFVIALTLIVPTVSLPYLLHYFKLVDAKNEIEEEATARLLSLEAALKCIDQMITRENIPLELANKFREQLERQVKIVQTQREQTPYSTLTDEYLIFKKLTIATLEAQRKAILALRRQGEIRDEIFHLILDELDLEEMRARSLRI